MSDISVFNDDKSIREENGLKFYNIPANYPLFKASKMLDNYGSMTLESGRFYFFGLKNMHPEYIENYEKEYGIIFEFITTQPLKLLALDDPDTVDILYENTDNSNIKYILDNNYGHTSGIRKTVSDKDRELSQYLCEQGYDGYAIKTMPTEGGGTFHTEFMICNATSKTRMIGKITSDEHVGHILQDAKMKKLEEERESARKRAREEKLSKRSVNENKGIFSLSRLNFSDYDYSGINSDLGVKPRRLFGGRNRTHKQKNNKSKSKKQNQKRQRKTRTEKKRKLPKKDRQ